MASMSHRSRPALADLAALVVALDRDERRPLEERRKRDYVLGERLQSAGSGRLQAGLLWMEGVCASDPKMRQQREQARAVITWSNLFLTGLGVLAGLLAAFGALYYDGSGRVNVVAVLAVLVVLPSVFLLGFLLAALPARVVAWIPGMTAVGSVAQGVSLGKAGLWVLRRLPQEWREAVCSLAGQSAAHQKVYSGVQKWILLRWSQLFAVGFQAAALVATIWLVVFSDLAFGWSTTLTSGNVDQDARRLHAVTASMAMPWRWAVEASSPSVELIRESRYYRAVPSAISPEEAARLGGWWRFLVLAMAVYGLLPRIVTVLVAQHHFRTAVVLAFTAAPGLTAVLARLEQARVVGNAIEPEAAPGGAGDQGPALRETTQFAGNIPTWINWCLVPVEAAHLKNEFGARVVLTAGGGASLEEDEAVIEQLVAEKPAAVGILVKAWEPPLLEFVDFIQSLRRPLGSRCEITIVPVGVRTDGTLEPATRTHLEVWRRRMLQVGDPWLQVVGMPEEVSR